MLLTGSTDTSSAFGNFVQNLDRVHGLLVKSASDAKDMVAKGLPRAVAKNLGKQLAKTASKASTFDGQVALSIRLGKDNDGKTDLRTQVIQKDRTIVPGRSDGSNWKQARAKLTFHMKMYVNASGDRASIMRVSVAALLSRQPKAKPVVVHVSSDEEIGFFPEEQEDPNDGDERTPRKSLKRRSSGDHSGRRLFADFGSDAE